MLQLRIEALGQHLDQAQDPSVWKQQLELEKFNVDNQLWDIAVEYIHSEATDLKDRLDNLDAALRENKTSERSGWAEYARLQTASEEVFRECLDLLGGLALRDRFQDERICRIADEYIKELASDTRRRPSFSILGLEAQLSSTLRRVVTMHFPEWTLWTLPLVAHEYGQVVIEESGLRKFADEITAERLAAAGGKGGDQAADGPPEDTDEEVRRAAKEQERRRVRIALADALATLLAGPAYAYAALLLRLNPLNDGAHTVSDRERAATILAVLREMNRTVPGKPPPHGEIVDRLEAYWRQSVDAAYGPSAEPAPLVNPARVRKAFSKHIVGSQLALYEAEHSARARTWAAAWLVQLKQGAPLTPPEHSHREHIREALNAAWRARVDATRDLEPPQGDEAQRRVMALGEVGLDLCESIIESRGPEGGGSALGRAPRPGGS
ncbi:hypothetical protein [Blastococcus deserti]